MLLALAQILAFFIVGFVAKRALGSRERINIIASQWVIRLSLPALVFDKIYNLDSFSLNEPQVYFPVSLPWLHWFLGVVTITLFARVLRWEKTIWGALALTVSLGNTSFVGIPLLRALLGEESIPTAIILDQLGSFLILSVVAIPLAMIFSPHTGKTPVLRIFWRAITFPAFLALVIALLLREVKLPDEIFNWILGPLGLTLAPVALFWVGYTLDFQALRKPYLRLPLTIGIVLKLVIFPALYFVLYSSWAARLGGISALTLRTTLLEGAMASMITSGIVAAEHGYDRDLAQLMVVISILGSLVSVPAWLWIILEFNS